MTKTFQRCLFAVVACLLVVFALSARAQVSTGTITGTVEDASAAVVPGAQVQAKNVENGFTRTVQTGAGGTYVFDFLPVGTYQLSITQAGFARQQRNSIPLAAGQQLTLNFALSTQEVAQAVTVTADPTLVDTESSQDNAVLSSKQISDLPVARQDYRGLLTQDTGAIRQTSSTNTPQNTGISLNGLPSVGFNLTVDSTNGAADPEIPSFGFYQAPNIINTVATDAIREISVLKGVAPATLGGAMSGGINIITRSGTDQLHGDLNYVSEISALDARNYFATYKPRLTFNQMSGSLGGALIKDRFFGFAAYENVRLSQGQLISGTSPTLYLLHIAPTALQPNLARLPIAPGASTDDPSCATRTTLITGAGTCLASATVQSVGALQQFDSSLVLRLDGTIDQRTSAYVRYTRNRPFKFAPALNSANPRETTAHGDNYNAGLIRQLGRFTSNSRFGYNRLRQTRADEGFGADQENITVSGVGTGNSEIFIKAGRIVTGDQQTAVILGKHNLQFGGIVQRNDAGRIDQNTASLKYSTLQQLVANTPSALTINFDITPFNLYQWQYGGYVQDDWKVSPRLTLNLGFRYDYFTVIQESSGRIFNRGYAPGLGYGFGDFVPANQLYQPDYHTGAQPRVGFAYSMNQGSTVITGGFGITTGRRPIFGGPIEVSPTSATSPSILNLTAQQIASAHITYPVPRSSFSTVLANAQAAGVIGTSFAGTALSPNQNNPYAIQWTTALQQILPAKMVLNIAYVANHGLNENITYIDNAPSRTTGRQPDPLFGTFRLYYPGDSSKYESMQVRLNKQAQFGIQFNANYTWAKSLSYGDDNLLQDSTPQDPANLRAEYGPSQVDVRDNFTANVIWDVPFDRWLNLTSRTSKALVNGWRLSSVINANTGLPFNVTNGASAYAGDRPNLLGNPYLNTYNAIGTHTYLRRAAFSAPALNSGSVQVADGTLTRNALRNVGAYTIDASAFKDFLLGERYHLQFHVDTFDIMNHKNLGGLVTDISSGSFGNFTTATNRTVQLGGKFNF